MRGENSFLETRAERLADGVTLAARPPGERTLAFLAHRLRRQVPCSSVALKSRRPVPAFTNTTHRRIQRRPRPIRDRRSPEPNLTQTAIRRDLDLLKSQRERTDEFRGRPLFANRPRLPRANCVSRDRAIGSSEPRANALTCVIVRAADPLRDVWRGRVRRCTFRLASHSREP